MLKTLIMKAAIVAFLGSMSFAAFAIADTQRFDVPAGELAAALESLAKQANVDLVYQESQVKGLRTKGVSGNFSAQDAITKLLEGTPLQLRMDEASGAILITTPTPSGPASTSLASGGARQAQAEPTNPSSGTGEGKREVSRSSIEDDKSSAIQDLPAPSDTGKAIPEVLVRGSRVLNMDIRRTRDDAQPYVIFDRETIAASGATTIEQFLNARLTMNSAAAPIYQQIGTFVRGGLNNINLRGLGSNQTLILIDGRRAADFYFGSNPDQASISGIPLGAIERIEVLPTTASGIYGGSATGGAINIVLRRDYSGIEAKVNFGNTFEGEASTRQFDLSGGFALEGGKTNVLVAASYSDSTDLLNQERDFVERGRTTIYANNPAFYLNAASPPLGGTTNIRSANGANLVLKDGTPLNSPITSVPAGYVGTFSDQGRALVANAGRYNLSSPDSVAVDGRRGNLFGLPDSESLLATVRREFTPNLQIFLEGSASNVSRTEPVGGGGNSATIPASSANNPFTQDVRVSIPFSQADSTGDSRTETRRAAGGLILGLPRGWRASADYTWSETSLRYTVPRNLTDVVPGALSWTAAVANGTVDVLKDTSTYPLDPSRYLEGRPPRSQTIESFESALKDATLRIAGPVMTLPGGMATISTLLEHRELSIPEASLFSFGAVTTFPSRSQYVDSVYLETLIPLISADNSVPGLRELALQIAGRHDRYTAHGVTGFVRSSAPTPIVRTRNEVTSTDPTVAVKFQPLANLTFRASYGTGFLPPNVSQLAPGVPTNPFFTSIFVDPKRGNTTVGSTEAPFTSTSGGNPDLIPEQSESWSAGIVLTPTFLDGLRLSVDWTQIDKNNNIITPREQQLLDNESLFPERITRGPNLPSDPAGWAGPVTSFNTTVLNTARAKVEAYDVQLDYQRQTNAIGTFAFHGLATWQTHYKTQLVPSEPIVENIGVTNNNPLEFKANAGITWGFQQWLLGWNTRYFDSYLVADPTSSAANLTFLNQGSRHVPSQVYSDAFARYRFAQAQGALSDTLAGTEIQVGVNNIFNEKPPFDASIGLFYSYYGDPRLTNFYVTLKHAF